jgi:hypothetical protein
VKGGIEVESPARSFVVHDRVAMHLQARVEAFERGRTALTHSGYVSKHSAVAPCAAARSATGPRSIEMRRMQGSMQGTSDAALPERQRACCGEREVYTRQAAKSARSRREQRLNIIREIPAGGFIRVPNSV